MYLGKLGRLQAYWYTGKSHFTDVQKYYLSSKGQHMHAGDQARVYIAKSSRSDNLVRWYELST